jgi:hypothetical protein
VAGRRTPGHLPRVGQEQHRTNDTVAQRVGVAVERVGYAAPNTVRAGHVADERDGVDVRAERGPGQAEAAGGGRERLPGRVTPGQRVARVVDLVQDDQRPAPLAAQPVQGRVGRDLGVGDGDAGVVGRGRAGAVAERRIDGDPDGGGRVGPLAFEVLGRRDDRDRPDRAGGEQVGRDGQGECCLAGARGGHRQEVAGPGLARGLVTRDRRALPGPQGAARGGRCGGGDRRRSHRTTIWRRSDRTTRTPGRADGHPPPARPRDGAGWSPRGRLEANDGQTRPWATVNGTTISVPELANLASNVSPRGSILSRTCHGGTR